MRLAEGPLENLEQWDDFVKDRYDPTKAKEEFRKYDDTTPPVVRDFYRLNHTNQTRDFVRQKKQQYTALQKGEMSVWEALEYLNTLVDDSDPDTDLSQIEHNLQAAEAIRKDGHPGWFVLTGLIHDLGKLLWLYGEPQWAVVGDTFPVGCAYSDKIVFHEFFRDNPDSRIPEYQTRLGVYE
ncbi:MAG: inositol oxygenase family protein, partial [Bryobacteraceae bacterium]